MKNYLLYILSIIMLVSCDSKVELDDSQAETFNKLYGNSGDDKGLAIHQLADGSFLIFGTIETEVEDKSTELALIKTDRFGNEQWSATYGRKAEDIAGGMDMKENGNIIITGTSSKTAQFATEENTTDIIVYELDASGNVLEDYVFDFNDNEEGHDIVYDRSSQGGFIVCGSSDAARSLAISDFTPNPKFTKDLLAVRYYVNGTSADTNVFQIGYEGNDEFNSIIYYEPENNFLVAGTVFLQGTRQSIIMNLQNELNTVFPVNGRDLAKTPGPASVSKIRQFGDGLFAIIGSYNSGRDNLFLHEVGADLNFVDSENPGVDIRKNGASRGYSFAYDNASDSYIIAGSTNESQGGGFDHYIVSYSRSLNRINWEKTYGGTGDEEAFAISPTSDGGYVFTGYTGFEGNSLINTIKVDNSGNLNP